jgi:hypothetical protein
MKRIISVLLAVIAVVLCSSGCKADDAGDGGYEYRGFVIEAYENAKGETVIVCISDDVESEYVIKSNTKISAPAKLPIDVGDYVMLSTMSRSDSAVEKIKVSPGYATMGRLVYLEGEETPFVLTEANKSGPRLLIRLSDERGTLPGASGIGDVIKVFHSQPISAEELTVMVEAMQFLENGRRESLTAEDVAFIESKGYKVISE